MQLACPIPTVLTVALLIPLGACSRANPAYNLDLDAGPKATGTGDNLDDTASSTGGGAEPDPTTSSEPEPGQTTGSADSSTSAATAEDSSGDPAECSLHDDATIDIAVTYSTGMPVAGVSPQCDVPFESGRGILSVEGNSIRHQACVECNCTPDEDSTVIFSLGDLPPPELPECGAVAAWEGPTDGGCSWRGLVVFEAGSVIPTFVATNDRDLPGSVIAGGGVSVELVPSEPCDIAHVCDTEPGRHALDFGGGVPVEVDEPQTVDIGFVASVPFVVTNRMSSVGLECRERVTWAAEIAR